MKEIQQRHLNRGEEESLTESVLRTLRVLQSIPPPDPQEEITLLRSLQEPLIGAGGKGGKGEKRIRDRELFCGFVLYLFRRRFGWSENSVIPVPSTVSSNSLTAMPLPGSSSVSKVQAAANPDLSSKSEIINLLDQLLVWLKQYPMDGEFILHALTFTFQNPLLNNLAVARHQAYIFYMEWLTARLEEKEEGNGKREAMHKGGQDGRMLQDEYFLVIRNGLTDTWSAIRASVGGKLSRLGDILHMEEVEHLFGLLVSLCESEEEKEIGHGGGLTFPSSTLDSWQAKEGALLGILCVIRKFSWCTVDVEFLEVKDTGMEGEDEEGKDEDNIRYGLRYGSFVANKSVKVYKEFPDFIKHHIHPVVFQMLKHPQLGIRETAIKALNAYLSRSQFKEAGKTFESVLKRLISLYQTCCGPCGGEEANPAKYIQYVDPYEAQSLLAVCTFIIRRLPAAFIMPCWPFYFSAFELYLSHPASTVRQVTSNVFKQLVAKDSSNPLLLKLVLQGLATKWGVCVSQLVQTQQMSEPGDDYCTQNKQTKAFNQPNSTESIGSPSSWEWREGRLLAYELVLKFIMTNHIHYILPMGLSSLTLENSGQKDASSRGSLQAKGDNSGANTFEKASCRGSNGSIPTTPSLIRRNYHFKDESGSGLASAISMSLSDLSTVASPQGTPRRPHPHALTKTQVSNPVSIPSSPLSPPINAIPSIDIDCQPPSPAMVIKSPGVGQGQASKDTEANGNKGDEVISPSSLQVSLSQKRTSSATSLLTLALSSKYADPSSIGYDRPFFRNSSKILSSSIHASFSTHKGEAHSFSLLNQISILDMEDYSPEQLYIANKSEILLSADGENNDFCVPGKCIGDKLGRVGNGLFCTAPIFKDLHVDSHLKKNDGLLFIHSFAGLVSLDLNQMVLIQDFLPGSRPVTPLAREKDVASTVKNSKDKESEFAATGWLEEISFDPFSEILMSIWLQTAESLGDSRWELRRMGDQLMPLVVEVIFAYNVRILYTLWDRFLDHRNSKLGYASALSLKIYFMLCCGILNFHDHQHEHHEYINERLEQTAIPNKSNESLLHSVRKEKADSVISSSTLFHLQTVLLSQNHQSDIEGAQPNCDKEGRTLCFISKEEDAIYRQAHENLISSWLKQISSFSSGTLPAFSKQSIQGVELILLALTYYPGKTFVNRISSLSSQLIQYIHTELCFLLSSSYPGSDITGLLVYISQHKIFGIEENARVVTRDIICEDAAYNEHHARFEGETKKNSAQVLERNLLNDVHEWLKDFFASVVCAEDYPVDGEKCAQLRHSILFLPIVAHYVAYYHSAMDLMKSALECSQTIIEFLKLHAKWFQDADDISNENLELLNFQLLRPILGFICSQMCWVLENRRPFDANISKRILRILRLAVALTVMLLKQPPCTGTYQSATLGEDNFLSDVLTKILRTITLNVKQEGNIQQLSVLRSSSSLQTSFSDHRNPPSGSNPASLNNRESLLTSSSSCQLQMFSNDIPKPHSLLPTITPCQRNQDGISVSSDELSDFEKSPISSSVPSSEAASLKGSDSEDEEDEDSDWDSTDDEEIGNLEAMAAVYGDFLIQLKHLLPDASTVVHPSQTRNYDSFVKVIKRLHPEDVKVIALVIKQGTQSPST
eukprot:Nk52_evm20s163 gene=Nk52_evmTU20s163